MWVRRDTAEIEKERTKNYRSIKRPLVFTFIFFLFIAFIVKLRYNQFGVSSAINPISWETFFVHLPHLIGFSLIFFTAIYYWQLSTKKPLWAVKPPLICTKCFKVMKHDDSLSCDCGGELVKIDEMKWIED